MVSEMFGTAKEDGHVMVPNPDLESRSFRSIHERPTFGTQHNKGTFEAVFGPSASFCFCGFHIKFGQHGWVSDFPVLLARNPSYEVHVSEFGELWRWDQHGELSTVLIPPKRFDFVVFRTRGAVWANAGHPAISKCQQWFLYPMCANLNRVRCVGRTRILQDRHFVKPLGLNDRDVFYRDDGTRGDSLLIVGGLKPRKGQVAMTRTLSDEVLARHELIFCGQTKEPNELQLLKRVLNERGARYRILGWLSKPQLAEQFRRAYAVLCPSLEDWNPRIVTEALSCGAPVVISERVPIADALRPFIVQRRVNAFSEAILSGLAQARPRPPAGLFSLEQCMANVFCDSKEPRLMRERIHDSLAWLRPRNGRSQRKLFGLQLL